MGRHNENQTTVSTASNDCSYEYIRPNTDSFVQSKLKNLTSFK